MKKRFDAQDEAQKWIPLSGSAQSAFSFWSTFLDFRAGPSNKQPLSPLDLSHFLTIIRAVSWVESRHGTGIGNQPARDPMQCGNPADPWWVELTGQGGAQDRFVGGPNAKNYNASALPDAASRQATFPDPAKLVQLHDQTLGHNDPSFTPTISFYWAIPILVHKINTPPNVPGGKTYQCGDTSRHRLIGGAVNYNGGGVPDYRQRINDAIDMIGWPSVMNKTFVGKRLKKALKSSKKPVKAPKKRQRKPKKK